MPAFTTLLKVGKAKQTKKPRDKYALVCLVNHLPGERFICRKLSVLKLWNQTSVTAAMSEGATTLSRTARETVYTSDRDPSKTKENFSVFATMGKKLLKVSLYREFRGFGKNEE